MAPLPVISGTSRVALQWRPFNAVNVMHFHQDSVDQPGLLALLSAHFTAPMWALNQFQQKIDTISITPLDGTSSTLVAATDGSAKFTGAGTGAPIPAAAAVLSLITVFRGRSARGRLFLGPTSEGAAEAGTFTPTQVNNVRAAWDAFQAAMITANTPQVVASYKNATALTVIGYSMRTACGTIRLRQSRLAA